METSRKPKNIKVHNEKLIIRILSQEESLPASEIAAKANLSITSVMKILDSLQNANAVKSIGKGPSTEEGGKRPELFAVDETYLYSIGASMLDDYAKIVLMDFRHNIIGSKDITLDPAQDGDGRLSIKLLGDAIRELVADNKLSPEKICGVSVGLNGIIDVTNGIIRHSILNENRKQNIEFGKMLAQELPEFHDIRVDNNGRFRGYTLLMHHPEYREKKLFYVTSGLHTVGCLLNKGELQRGINGFLGEVGHMTVLPDYRKRKCGCGGYGCFESLVNKEGILDMAIGFGDHAYPEEELLRKLKEGTAVVEDIFTAADAGNEYAYKLVHRLAKYFGLLVRNIMLVSDPELIVIDGSYVTGCEAFREAVRKEVLAIPFFDIGNKADITFVVKGDTNSGEIGAAVYALDRYLRHTDMI